MINGVGGCSLLASIPMFDATHNGKKPFRNSEGCVTINMKKISRLWDLWISGDILWVCTHQKWQRRCSTDKKCIHNKVTSLKYTRKYGRLCQPLFSPFGYGRVQQLFRMTNIWNDNNSEMTLIWKEWKNPEGMIKSGRNDSNTEEMAIMQKECNFLTKKIFWL